MGNNRKSRKATPTPDPTPDFDDVMRAARRWYYTAIRTLVEDAIAECRKATPGESTEARRAWLGEWIDETTNGHNAVIVTRKAWFVLAASDNCDAAEDELGADVAITTEARACQAMRVDAWQLLDARADEWSAASDD
jgi:hypothetical protein